MKRQVKVTQQCLKVKVTNSPRDASKSVDATFISPSLQMLKLPVGPRQASLNCSLLAVSKAQGLATPQGKKNKTKTHTLKKNKKNLQPVKQTKKKWEVTTDLQRSPNTNSTTNIVLGQI